MNPPAKSLGERAAEWFAKNEALVIVAFALLLFLVNLASSTLYPTSWMDESMFSDPAINFCQGKGFTSTAWWQSKEVTWSGNVPLYTSVLVPWIKVMGIGLVQIRAFNYVVISMTLLIFWLGIKRLELIKTPVARIGLIVVVFLSYPLCFPYRSARPDCLGIMICAVAVLAWSWKNRTARNVCLFLCGFLVPSSGLQLIPYLGLIFLLVLWLEGRKALVPLVVMGTGILVGGLALFSFYYANHLTGVIDTIKETRRLHQLAEAASGHGEPSLSGKIATKIKRIFSHQLKDYGILPTLLALAVLTFDRRTWSDKKVRRLALLAFVSSFAIVSALETFLHFLDYYHWMNFIILAIAVFVITSQVWNLLNPYKKALVLLLFAGTVVGGLPLRLVLGAAFGQEQEFASMQKIVKEQIQPTDIIFSDFMGYFPLKMRAAEVFVPPYLQVMKEAEKQSVNVLVLDQINFEGYSKVFITDGRNWTKVATISSQPTRLGEKLRRFFRNYNRQPTSCGYAITILRREPQTQASIEGTRSEGSK